MKLRITNNTITNNYLTSLNQSLKRQSDIQEQLTDGKAIHRPSDDPIKTIRSLRFNTNLKMNEQYTQNASDARSWMETSDSAMSDLSSIMIQVKELTIQASNMPLDQAAVQTIGGQVDTLINQMITIGNTKIGDRYVFAGQNDKTAPFTRIGDTVTYNGDNHKISMPIQPGTVDATKDSVNLTGSDVFGAAGTGMFKDMIDIKNHMLSGTGTDQAWLSNTGLGFVDTNHAAMLQSQTLLGTRMSAYEMAQNMLENNNTIITKDVSNNEDLDMAAAIIDQKTSENIYNAALSVGSKIMPLSLVDFLK